MINDEELKEKLEAATAPRVNEVYMESRISEVITEKLPKSETVTICQIVLDNGFSVIGESACVNAENYNEEIGGRLAYDDAFNKLWPLFGFLLAEEQFKGEK